MCQQRRKGAAKPGGRGHGIPTGGCSLGPREYHDPPPHAGWGRDLEVRRGGGGSWYSRGPREGGVVVSPPWPGGVVVSPWPGGGSWYSRGSGGGAALPVGVPRPRPPGLAAPFRRIVTVECGHFFMCFFVP